MNIADNCFSLVVIQSLGHVWLFVTPWTAVCQALLSFTISWILLELMPTESGMPSIHLILCYPLLLLPLTVPTVRIFSNVLALCIRWPKYWCFSFSISLLMNIQGWFPLGLTGLTSLLSLVTCSKFLEIQILSVGASLVAQRIKNLPALWETWIRSLGWEDPLEKEMATHSSILAW